ncbi:lipid A ethanolaminephosphotransferase [Chryseobacterium culicis]|uniref:Lipid A ethanolaminephosphotransferase n=2 Tax=Chryseobacterium culicis TaxID=680127 RepID=A0A1H6IR70_CHRCI|nr:lipid A ethanolaminephosphotransferase [Chryseobacterium culicis]
MKLAHFAILMSLLTLLLFHIPFYCFVFKNLKLTSYSGIMLIVNLIVLMIVVNALFYYLIYFLFRFIAKVLMVISFIINSVALYFIDTYGIIIDESMIGNIFNTNYSESSSYISLKLVIYIFLFGVFPSIYISKANIILPRARRFALVSVQTVVFIFIIVYANSNNWLWIDKNSKTLGGLAMPWSYSVNSLIFYINNKKKTEREILLPKATIQDNEKAVIILVIGESARKQNFSLYGYNKNTNPQLTKLSNVYHFDAISTATYTTAGVKSILEHKKSDDLNEILPNYLYRNNVEVIWRTTNWGEPPLHIKKYQNGDILRQNCKGVGCNYDEILLTDLEEEIQSSKNNKILVILHTSTSHGPSYNKKYPTGFEIFKPVCNSVDLANCSNQDLINAYDNTILYTDHILSTVIGKLKKMNTYKSAMIFVSDHGESLGENNLYMHGLPIKIAPKEQYEIPFIVWISNNSIQLKSYETLSQNHVFHSVLNFLSIKSPIYDEEMNIFIK